VHLANFMLITKNVGSAGVIPRSNRAWITTGIQPGCSGLKKPTARRAFGLILIRKGSGMSPILFWQIFIIKTDISISFADVYYITIIFYGCADFLNFYTTVSGDQPAEKFCNFIPTCDYYFESDGNGEDPVPVSENGNDGTVEKFDMTTTPEAVAGNLEVFFTTSTVTVIKNEVAGFFEITLTGAPNDLLYIDGVQGIKSNCRKIYIA